MSYPPWVTLNHPG